MKLSVSIDQDDIAFIDTFASTHEVASRSAVIQRALRLLRSTELRDAYTAAFEEWTPADRAAWDAALGDGLS